MPRQQRHPQWQHHPVTRRQASLFKSFPERRSPHLCQLLLVSAVVLTALAAPAAAQDGWHECSAQAHYPGPYGAEAIANLTSFRSELLSRVWSSFDPEVAFAQGHKRYDPMNPVVTCPPHRPLMRYGKAGSASRHLCSLAHMRQPCLVYSIGAGAQYAFERDVLLRTKCEVHTFDCKINGTSIHARHTFHKTCVGGAGSGGAFQTLAEVQRRLGHQRRSLDVLKLDISGHEPGVLAELQRGGASGLLPRQVAVEMHLRPQAAPTPEPKGNEAVFLGEDAAGGGAAPSSSKLAQPAARTPAQMALLFLHLANQGYAVVSRSDTSAAGEPGCCAEFTLLQVEQQWAGPGSAGGMRLRPDKKARSRLGVWAARLAALRSSLLDRRRRRRA